MGLSKTIIAAMIAAAYAAPDGNFWTLPVAPSPSGLVSYVTNSNASGAGSLAQALADRAVGGVIAIDPTITLGTVTLSANPSATVFITSGTSVGGLVNQPLPAVNYARNTRATITKLRMGNGVSNFVFYAINVGDAALSCGDPAGGDGYLIRNAGVVGESYYLNMFNCEVSGVPYGAYDYPIFISAASTAGFSVGDTITGLTSGTVASVNAIPSSGWLYAVITSVGSGGGAAQSQPFILTEGLSKTGPGGASISTVSALKYFVDGYQYGVGKYWRNLRIQGCLFKYVTDGIKIAGTGVGGGTWEVYDNDFDCVYQDAIAGGTTQAMGVPAQTIIAFNRAYRPVGDNGDYGNPHSDANQLFGAGAGTGGGYGDFDWPNVYNFANIAINGFSRAWISGVLHQALITSPAYYYTEKAVGNLCVSYSDSLSITNAFTIDGDRDCYVMGNIQGHAHPTAAAGTGRMSRLYPRSGGGLVEKYNICERNSDSVDTNNNVDMVPTNARYAAIFDGPFPLTAATIQDALAEIKTAFRPKLGGPAEYIRDYVDWAGKRIKIGIEPAVFAFSPQNDVALNTVTSSEWRRNWTGAQEITIIGGEYRTADDSAGTNATAWSSAPGTVGAGKWLQLRLTSSGSGGTSATCMATVGGIDSGFSCTTVSSSYVAVSNGGAVWSKTPALTGNTTFQRAIFAFRLTCSAYVGSGNIIFDSAASNYFGMRSAVSPSGNLRVYMYGSTYSFDVPGGAPTAGQTKTVIIVLDLTQALSTNGIKAIVEGVVVTPTSVLWPASVPITATIQGGALGFLKQANGAGNIYNGSPSMFYADYGGAGYTLPDLSDSGKVSDFAAKFTHDMIGANGSGPTGAQPKLCYYGTLAEWNAGLANKGSLAATLTNTGGSYA